uniref:Uncharacterized protein n=1 Tax=Alexandrium catenella TaxID=2925 RepID=A0A7S1RB25_ALECA|mmetsp:Transcript_50531/g.135159  ORF Transcript_50531/g.135159 Transcript_50531/m.135159 type:complete len:220 (+) Transcript_50531:118-777(+)
MKSGTQALLATLGLVSVLVLMWAVVPTEQSLDAHFPNVLYLSGFGSETIDPISFDNSTMPVLEKSQASSFNGVYQFDPLFYHKTLDRFISWEDREKLSVWECTFFCSPMNRSAPDARLGLVHTSIDDGKKHIWYLLELRDDDANSPIVYARSKFRKAPTYRVPWMTVTPGGEIKPHDLKEVYLMSAWDAFRFDTPLKWTVTAVLIGGATYLWWARKGWD